MHRLSGIAISRTRRISVHGIHGDDTGWEWRGCSQCAVAGGRVWRLECRKTTLRDFTTYDDRLTVAVVMEGSDNSKSYKRTVDNLQTFRANGVLTCLLTITRFIWFLCIMHTAAMVLPDERRHLQNVQTRIRIWYKLHINVSIKLFLISTMFCAWFCHRDPQRRSTTISSVVRTLFYFPNTAHWLFVWLVTLLVRPKTIVFGRTSVLRMMFFKIFFRASDLRDAWADWREILHDGQY